MTFSHLFFLLFFYSLFGKTFEETGKRTIETDIKISRKRFTTWANNLIEKLTNIYISKLGHKNYFILFAPDFCNPTRQ